MANLGVSLGACSLGMGSASPVHENKDLLFIPSLRPSLTGHFSPDTLLAWVLLGVILCSLEPLGELPCKFMSLRCGPQKATSQ